MKYKTVAVFVLVVILSLFIMKTFNLEGYKKVCFETFCVNAEVKDTNEERALGLMGRENLNEDEGMLFIFETPGGYNFWMKNMLIPIDIIFLDENKKIITIYENVSPCVTEPCELYPPSTNTLYVVETKAGFSSRHNLEEGQTVDFR